MKIGVITFWDSQDNYGQVLQAYALQTFLKLKGHDAFLIRYDKSKSVQKNKPSLVEQVVNVNWKKVLDKNAIISKLESLKNDAVEAPDRKFNEFRNENLQVSSRIYESAEELIQNPPEADVYICGSDQVWNYEFIGDFRPFFLQFGGEDVVRMSYAASFGHKELPEDIATTYQKYLRDFEVVSVRESSGLEICRKMNIEHPKLLPDPCALLDKRAWMDLSKTSEVFAATDNPKIFIYTLGNRPSIAREGLFNHVSQNPDNVIIHTSIHKDTSGDTFPTIEEWLGYFAGCDIVLTNSFHGMLFSILFNKNFIGLPCTGANEGMNERLTTLMGALGLEDHLLYEYNEEKVNELSKKKIDWEAVNSKVAEWRRQADDFLNLAQTQEPKIQVSSLA